MSGREITKPAQPKVVTTVKDEIGRGNLVVLIGGPCSGKSWLLNQLFEESAIIDKSIHHLGGNYAEISLKALDKWNARTKSSIAVDELQLLKGRELVDIAVIASSCGKGLVLAAQQEVLIPKQIFNNFVENGKQVVVIYLEHWKSGNQLPIWNVGKRIMA